MEYLVQVSGNTLSKKTKTYVVNAKTNSEAEKIANENFNAEYTIIDECTYSKPYNRTRKAILAYIFMLIPILLSCITWYEGHEDFCFAPTLSSCLYGIALYSSFVVRFKSIPRTVGSWIDALFCVFVTLLLATFIQILLKNQRINLFGIKELTINIQILLPVTLVLSWLGLKLVSVICMAGISLLALFNISFLSDAMGHFFGPLYIISAFMGLLFYLSVEPATTDIVSHLKMSVVKGVNNSYSDFLQAKETVLKIGKQNKTSDSIESISNSKDI